MQKYPELQKQQNRGVKPKTPVCDQGLLTLDYIEPCPTFANPGSLYGVSESWARKTCHRLRPVLAEVVGLRNPDKIRYGQIKRIIVDVAVQPTGRPKKGQKKHYSRYKRRHVVKAQIIDNEDDDRIIPCQVEPEGSKADVTACRECKVEIDPRIKKVGISVTKASPSYDGVPKQDPNLRTPVKKPKGGGLTKNEKRRNRRFRRKRVKVEHTIRKCRVHRIVKETYRNKLRHIQQVWLIVCGLVNLSSS